MSNSSLTRHLQLTPEEAEDIRAAVEFHSLGEPESLQRIRDLVPQHDGSHGIDHDIDESIVTDWRTCTHKEIEQETDAERKKKMTAIFTKLGR